MDLPDLVAHRGWAKRFPENTLAALSAALDAGARWVETDVQISADGVPVLFHDRTLERMCGVPGAVHQRSAADLRGLACAQRAAFGERFATERIATLAGLVDLLRRHPDATAFVEVKRASIEHFGLARVLDRVLAAVEPAREQVVLISFSVPLLLEAREKTTLPLGAVFDRWDDREAPAILDLVPEYVFCDVEGLPKDDALVHPGARVALYEVADAQLALDLGARGAELVETFEIGEMIEAFRRIADEA